jgi:C4-dicarboxylate transporter DctM subunit
VNAPAIHGGTTVFLKFLDHLEEWLISALIACATLLIFFAVIHRYGSGLSIAAARWFDGHGMVGVGAVFNGIFNKLIAMDVSWAQELCIIMFVWMAKFGAAYGVRTGVHVGVDVALKTLPAPSRHRVILFGLMCGALFTGIIATFGGRFVLDMYHTGQTSNDLEAPMWIVYLAIPVGSALMSFRFMQVAWRFARTGDLPHTDESHVEGLEHQVSTKDVDAVMPGGAR